MKMDVNFEVHKKFNISEDLFASTLKKAEELYKERPIVDCPFLKTPVHFNAKGFEHIKFKEWNRSRHRSDQYIRLKLLKVAPEIIAKSHTVQGFWEKNDWEQQKKHGVWQKIIKKVFYYEFIAVVGKVRVKIIVKEVEGGVKYFWSIIPFWKMNSISNKRVLHEGNLETD